MLIVCEKPSVAKDFAQTLGCGGGKGYYGKGDTVITYCVGHLFELCAPESYNPEFKKWRLEDLPIIPHEWRYERKAEVSEQAECVINLLKRHATDEILIATDAGREGELIARIVLREAGIRDISRCRRFWVSEALTEQVIREGIKNAKRLSEYNPISLQGFARQHADWLVGINLSRYMSIGNSVTFSVGRVQTAILSAIASRNEEAANFISKPYREMEASVESGNGHTVTAHLINPETGKTPFMEREWNYPEEAAAYCREHPDVRGTAENARKSEKAEKLLNITGLQKKAYKLYGYSPDKTLGLAQSLYEQHKCLSYPRTPSRVMGDNNADLFREKFELLKDKYPGLSTYCDPGLIDGKNKHIFNSAELEDHHALIPLKELPEGAGAEEKNIYEIVVRSFFTVCMNDFVYEEKRITFTAGPYTLQAAIRETVQSGWKASVPKKGEGEEEEGYQEVPDFDERECRVSGTEIVNKKTGPRKEYSIDTLLAFMENPRGESGEKLAGLGTPATRAEIIRTLTVRGYAEDRGKKLSATEKGKFLLKEMKKDEELRKMTDVFRTTEWERELEEDPEGFEGHIGTYIRSCIKSGPREVYQRESLGICPMCGNRVEEGKKNYYCAGYKSEKACTFVIWKEITGAEVTPEDARIMLAGKTTRVKNCTSKAGKKFRAAFKLERNGIINLIFQEDKNRKQGHSAGRKGKK
jgi:DNA topoisomerase-3